MNIICYGALNIDYVYVLNHIILAGETQTSDILDVLPGGKGLNQSIALAKSGMKVYLAGKIGEEGRFLLDWCNKFGVDTKYVSIDNESKTGHAIIQVDKDGENSIILFGGSNRKQTKKEIDNVLSRFDKKDVILLQNEINNLPYLIDKAYEKGMFVVLNPSPMDEKIHECDLSKVSLFILNEIEGEQISDEKEPYSIIRTMTEKYNNAAILLTLGENGALYFDGGEIVKQDSFKVDVIDTTAAGDTFTGYFLSGLLSENGVKNALEMAAKASAIAVSRKGASVSIPLKEEVLYFL